ncbi:hypothetical protein U1Q18_037387 [Sarracenia purpurea var. burkii]
MLYSGFGFGFGGLSPLLVSMFRLGVRLGRESTKRHADYREVFEGHAYLELVGGREVFLELIGEEEEDVSGGVEGLGGSEVIDLLVVEARGGEDLDGVECGLRIVDTVEGAEVCQFLDGGGLRMRDCKRWI